MSSIRKSLSRLCPTTTLPLIAWRICRANSKTEKKLHFEQAQLNGKIMRKTAKAECDGVVVNGKHLSTEVKE